MFRQHQTEGFDTMWRMMAYATTVVAGALVFAALITLTVPVVQGGEGWQPYRGYEPYTGWDTPTPLPRGKYEYEDGYTVSKDSRYLQELAKKPTWVPPEKQPYWKPLPLHFHYDHHGNRRPCYAPH